MANNFSDTSSAITSNSLTDVFTATAKSLVIAGTVANTSSTTSVNIKIAKMDATTSTTFTIVENAPLVVMPCSFEPLIFPAFFPRLFCICNLPQVSRGIFVFVIFPRWSCSRNLQQGAARETTASMVKHCKHDNRL